MLNYFCELYFDLYFKLYVIYMLNYICELYFGLFQLINTINYYKAKLNQLIYYITLLKINFQNSTNKEDIKSVFRPKS